MHEIICDKYMLTEACWAGVSRLPSTSRASRAVKSCWAAADTSVHSAAPHIVSPCGPPAQLQSSAPQACSAVVAQLSRSGFSAAYQQPQSSQQSLEH